MRTVALAPELLSGDDLDPRWATGPFLGLKVLPPKAKGKRYEQIASRILAEYSHDVQPAINSDHDRVIDGVKHEIKGSTVTKNTDDWFSFLQVRPAQDYESLLLVCLWFDGRVDFYRLNKTSIKDLIEQRIFKPQHGGSRGNSGTFCYNGNMKPFSEFFWFSVTAKAG